MHPVVLQLLHDEKIPPSSLPGRMDKLVVGLTLLGKKGGRRGFREWGSDHSRGGILVCFDACRCLYALVHMRPPPISSGWPSIHVHHIRCCSRC